MGTRPPASGWLRIARLFALPLAAAAGEPAPWRSELYPEDWTPQFTLPDGRFLHDFSYAGYRLGEEPPVVEGPEFVLRGVDATGASDVAPAIQALIDKAAAAGGGVVRIPAGLYRCENTLFVRHSRIVLRGDGPDRTRLFFPRLAGPVPAGHHSQIYVSGQRRLGPDIPLSRDGTNRAAFVEVADAGPLAPGREVAVGWIISPEFVGEHGMTGVWKVFNDAWSPFFLRTVTAVETNRNPVRVHLDVPLRYPARVRDGAGIRLVEGLLSECGIEDLGLADAVGWEEAWSRNATHLVNLRDVRDAWVRNVRSFPSPHPDADGRHLQNSGILVIQSRRVTLDRCDLRHPQNRGGPGSGYLFHISRSNEVLTRDCTAVAGRHNFIVNWGFGATGLVWLRCRSEGSRSYDHIGHEGRDAYSEYHHSLAMACLVDACTLEDGWFGGNRGHWSSGAGATVTQSVYWNSRGRGAILSWQGGHGYIIGTGPELRVETGLAHPHAWKPGPEDTREGIGRGAGLRPASLYEDQRARRLARGIGNAGP